MIKFLLRTDESLGDLGCWNLEVEGSQVGLSGAMCTKSVVTWQLECSSYGSEPGD